LCLVGRLAVQGIVRCVSGGDGICACPTTAGVGDSVTVFERSVSGASRPYCRIPLGLREADEEGLSVDQKHPFGSSGCGRGWRPAAEVRRLRRAVLNVDLMGEPVGV